MNPNCPKRSCSLSAKTGPKSNQVIRYGSFYRSSDSRKIGRYLCKCCGGTFSRATLSPGVWQKRRRITHPLKLLLSSGVTKSRAAVLLRADPKTIARRSQFLARESRKSHSRWLKSLEARPIVSVQFDDLETFEHTKCKPLSVALVVEPDSRKIIGFQVSRMPAKGRLAKIARKKYPKRKDQRIQGWNRLMRRLTTVIASDAEWKSDDHPFYPKLLRLNYPQATHVTVRGGRGAITGQGELKKLVFDPIFSLNHTCAMLRANMSRLFRRTWNTTKTLQGLVDHLSIFIGFHNEHLTPDLIHQQA